MIDNYEIGTECSRNNCKGILQSKAEDMSCSCHINPPCSKCTSGVYCYDCGFDSDEEYKSNNPVKTSNNFTNPEVIRSLLMTPKEKFEEKCKIAKDDDIVTQEIESWHSGGTLRIRYPKNVTLDDLLKKLGYCHINLPKFKNYRDDDRFSYVDLSVFTD